MSIHGYIIDHEGFDWPALLSEWAWFLPTTFTVWILNRFGDLFIVLDGGTVHMLEMGSGHLAKVADNREDFGVKLDEGDNANQWLMIPLIDQLVALGIVPGEGQCYGYKFPPVLGGDYTVENTCLRRIGEQLSVCGSIHHQIKNLPDGAQVDLKVVR